MACQAPNPLLSALLPASHPALCEALFIPCHQLHRVMQRPGHRAGFLCCLLRISKSLWTRRDVVLQQQTLFPEEVRRWLRSHCSGCREFSAGPEAITQNWREMHTKKKHNLHTDQAKRKITVPLCCHPDKLSPHFREFLTKIKWEQTSCLWQANTDKRSYSHIFEGLWLMMFWIPWGKHQKPTVIKGACA